MLKRLALKYLVLVLLVILIGAVFCMSQYRINTFTWPEGAATWALFLTLLVIAWQSTETRDAAKAALLNAEAVINAERAWMIPKITQPDEREFDLACTKEDGWRLPIEITFKNHGRTPATAIRGVMEIASEKIERKTPNVSPTLILVLGVPPKYRERVADYVPGAVYVGGDETSSYLGVPKELIVTETPAWNSGDKCLCVKGFIEYKDAFGELRVSRFCYAYQNVSSMRALQNVITDKPKREREFRKAGPDPYNAIT